MNAQKLAPRRPVRRVRVVLRNADVIVDRFVERTGKFGVLARHRTRWGELKSFGIGKGASR